MWSGSNTRRTAVHPDVTHPSELRANGPFARVRPLTSLVKAIFPDIIVLGEPPPPWDGRGLLFCWVVILATLACVLCVSFGRASRPLSGTERALCVVFPRSNRGPGPRPVPGSRPAPVTAGRAWSARVTRASSRSSRRCTACARSANWTALPPSKSALHVPARSTGRGQAECGAASARWPRRH